MYKVTKAFIYRAKLYPIGRELTEREHDRMMRDKVAIRRGIPDKVALSATPAPVIVQEEIKMPEVVVEKKPAAKKAPAKKAPAKKSAAKKKAPAKKPAAKKKAPAKKAPAKPKPKKE